MGFLSNMVSATVKTALTPLAVAKDAVDVVTTGKADNTKKLVESAINDVEKAID